MRTAKFYSSSKASTCNVYALAVRTISPNREFSPKLSKVSSSLDRVTDAAMQFIGDFIFNSCRPFGVISPGLHSSFEKYIDEVNPNLTYVTLMIYHKSVIVRQYSIVDPVAFSAFRQWLAVNFPDAFSPVDLPY